MKRRSTMVLLLSSVVLAGCGDNSGAGAVNLAPDQNVTVAIAREFGSLDPARLTSQADADVAGNLFNGVVRVSSVGGAVVPDLAVALPDLSSDGRTYTFHLRRGVNFSNGDPLTAGDFVYSWSRVAALQGPDAAIFSDVVGYSATVSGGAAGLAMSGLVAKGDLTLEVHLAAPQGYLLDRLASVAAAVVDRKVIASAGDPLGRGANQNWANQPSTEVGTGPYRLAARAANSADFSPVAGWWGDPKPVVRRLRLVVTPASSDPITAFIADSYDLVGYAGMEHLSVDALTRVRQGPSQELTTVARGAFTWVGFNHKQGPFAGLDPPATKLRHAFALALDRTKIGSALCHDSGTCLPATGGPVPPGMRGYTGDESDPLATFDPGQARSLLKQADPDGSATKKLAIAFADTPENGAIFQFLQDQWQKNLGVRVEPLVPHSASSAGPGTAALVIQRWQARYDDPQQLLDGYFATSAGPTGGGFSDPQFDKLAAKGDGEPAASSLGTYATAISRLQTDAAYVPLYYDSGNLLVGAHVVGAAMGTLADGPWSSLEVLQ